MNIHLNQKMSLFFFVVVVLLLKILLKYDSTNTAIRTYSLLELRAATLRCFIQG